MLNSLLLLIIFIIVALVLYIPLSTYINEWGSSKYTQKELAELTAERLSEYKSSNEVVDGIHVATGMVYDKNFNTVKATCTSCHSSKLIIQNRATRDGWKDMIVWMQETQGLPELGKLEPIVLDYLAKHYAPEKIGRRAKLEIVEWYNLESD